MSELRHAGVGHDRLTLDGAPGKSGRYPWASGDSPYQRDSEPWYVGYELLKKQGVPEAQIAAEFGFSSTTEARKQISIDKAEREQEIKQRAQEIYLTSTTSPTEIARAISTEYKQYSEATVRGWIKNGFNTKMTAMQSTAKSLIDESNKTGFVDIGKGVAQSMGISDQALKNAVQYLVTKQGYETTEVQVNQLGTHNKTTVQVLVNPKKLTGDTKINYQDNEITLNEYSKILTDKMKDKNELTVDEIEERVRKSSTYQVAKIAASNNDIVAPGFDTREKTDVKIGFEKPASVSSDRIMVKYADVTYDDGFTGQDRDGLIEIRRGVNDLSLGDALYAQVRINVDNKNYIKGMAVYSDNLPDGVDIVVNSNKKSDKSLDEVLKPLKTLDNGKVDWSNPFGANIEPKGQSYYEDPNGKYKGKNLGEDYDPSKKYSLNKINKVNEEGKWDEWSKGLSVQFLSKQNQEFIDTQLNKTYEDYRARYEEICSITNPTLRKQQLEEFSETCDKAAWEMKASAMPRQKTQVILPAPTVPPTQIYAPNFNDGETVCLIRYPHAGTFEIAQLTVNNKNREAISMVGKNPTDCVCINPATAEKLSGADFDGDTVVVIPNNNRKIEATASLPGLKNFDSKQYKISSSEADKLYPSAPPGKTISPKNKQKQMGIVSNLIQDMSTQEWTEEDMAAAVRHSMVIIDSEKHVLDWKQSAKDNHIDELVKKYQVEPSGSAGASTIMSRHKQEMEVPERKPGVKLDNNRRQFIDPKTGEKLYENTNRLYDKGHKDENGQWVVDERNVVATQKVNKILEVDPYSLVGNDKSRVEMSYANHASRMKALANESRKTMINTKDIERDPQAYSKYKPVVQAMNNEVKKCQQNAPVERQAQLLGNYEYSQWHKAHPDADDDACKKAKSKFLSSARATTGAHRNTIDITDEKWEAIQNGAVSKSMLEDILKYAEPVSLKEHAMPKAQVALTDSQKSMIARMIANGYTSSEIAAHFDISTSTVANIAKDIA